jgi:NAD(P)-dependent dehydrogenase (short-subunit alcohol dehydrogenase family)
MNKFIVSAVVALGLMTGAAQASTVLVTGTNRGIGLEFVKQYAEKGWDVIATARNPDKADELQALAKKHKKVKVEKLDVTDVAQIEALAAKYKGQPVDVLINNAGTLGDVPKQTIGTLDQAEFVNVMNANAFGALKLTEAFKPNLQAGQMKKAFGMTSGLGSSELTARRGGFYAYRMSKAAVNIGFRALAADWKADGIMVGIIAPGMVETDLLRASNFPGKGISTQESVAGMIKTIEGMTFENNSKPVNYNGETIPW